MSKHIELAKKLKALADRGVGGEKENAEKMLSDLLLKHNLTIEDIEGEETIDYFFKISKTDIRLFHQVVRSVNYNIKMYGSFPVAKIKELALKGNYMLNCTVAEYIEIESKWSVYKRLYKEEEEIFYSAFCRANDILVRKGVLQKTSEMTPEELSDFNRSVEMATNIKKETIRKQLSK